MARKSQAGVYIKGVADGLEITVRGDLGKRARPRYSTTLLNTDTEEEKAAKKLLVHEAYDKMISRGS